MGNTQTNPKKVPFHRTSAHCWSHLLSGAFLSRSLPFGSSWEAAPPQPAFVSQHSASFKRGPSLALVFTWAGKGVLCRHRRSCCSLPSFCCTSQGYSRHSGLNEEPRNTTRATQTAKSVTGQFPHCSVFLVITPVFSVTHLTAPQALSRRDLHHDLRSGTCVWQGPGLHTQEHNPLASPHNFCKRLSARLTLLLQRAALNGVSHGSREARRPVRLQDRCC